MAQRRKGGGEKINLGDTVEFDIVNKKNEGTPEQPKPVSELFDLEDEKAEKEVAEDTKKAEEAGVSAEEAEAQTERAQQMVNITNEIVTIYTEAEKKGTRVIYSTKVKNLHKELIKLAEAINEEIKNSGDDDTLKREGKIASECLDKIQDAMGDFDKKSKKPEEQKERPSPETLGLWCARKLLDGSLSTTDITERWNLTEEEVRKALEQIKTKGWGGLIDGDRVVLDFSKKEEIEGFISKKEKERKAEEEGDDAENSNELKDKRKIEMLAWYKDAREMAQAETERINAERTGRGEAPLTEEETVAMEVEFFTKKLEETQQERIDGSGVRGLVEKVQVNIWEKMSPRKRAMWSTSLALAGTALGVLLKGDIPTDKLGKMFVNRGVFAVGMNMLQGSNFFKNTIGWAASFLPKEAEKTPEVIEMEEKASFIKKYFKNRKNITALAVGVGGIGASFLLSGGAMALIGAGAFAARQGLNYYTELIKEREAKAQKERERTAQETLLDIKKKEAENGVEFVMDEETMNKIISYGQDYDKMIRNQNTRKFLSEVVGTTAISSVAGFMSMEAHYNKMLEEGALAQNTESSEPAEAENSPAETGEKKWWQFWKKGTVSQAESDTAPEPEPAKAEQSTPPIKTRTVEEARHDPNYGKGRVEVTLPGDEKQPSIIGGPSATAEQPAPTPAPEYRVDGAQIAQESTQVRQDTMGQTFNSKQLELEQSQAKVEELEAQQAKLTEEVQTAKADIEASKGTTDEATIKEAETKVAEKEASMKEIETKMAELKKDIAKLDADNDNLADEQPKEVPLKPEDKTTAPAPSATEGGEDASAEEPEKTPAANAEAKTGAHGIRGDKVSFTFGKGGVPNAPEIALRQLALDSMNVGDTLDATEAARSLNVAQNLWKLMNGEDLNSAGFKASEFEAVADFDPKTGEVIITDKEGFNKLLGRLVEHSEKINVDGAKGFVGNVSVGSWARDLRADNMDLGGQGVTGHDGNIKIEDFSEHKTSVGGRGGGPKMEDIPTADVSSLSETANNYANTQIELIFGKGDTPNNEVMRIFTEWNGSEGKDAFDFMNRDLAGLSEDEQQLVKFLRELDEKTGTSPTDVGVQEFIVNSLNEIEGSGKGFKDVLDSTEWLGDATPSPDVTTIDYGKESMKYFGVELDQTQYEAALDSYKHDFFDEALNSKSTNIETINYLRADGGKEWSASRVMNMSESDLIKFPKLAFWNKIINNLENTTGIEPGLDRFGNKQDPEEYIRYVIGKISAGEVRASDGKDMTLEDFDKIPIEKVEAPIEENPNPYDLGKGEIRDVDKTYDKNIEKVFGKGDQTNADRLLNNTLAKKVLTTEPGGDEEQKAMIQAMQKLYENPEIKNNVVPVEEGPLTHGETTGEWYKRALQYLKSINKLDKFGNIKGSELKGDDVYH